jgi:iron complex outermembrane recepter protein
MSVLPLAAQALLAPPAYAREVAAQSDTLDEVIVTAQKREERLKDVPVPVTAIQATALVDDNQINLQNYYDQVPGLSLTTDNRGSPVVSVRGISTGIYNNPTVGVTVDDVPYGSETSASFGWAATNIDPNELQRVEVLRGPQGALYGASSIGGLVKFVTVDPSTKGMTGYVHAGTDAVHNGSGVGYSFGTGVNVPVTDTFAIRISGFTRRSPGYIDNPVLHIDGANASADGGGRLAALWQPSQGLSLKLSAMYQSSKLYGSDYVDVGPGLGDLQQEDVPGGGRYDRDIQAYSATLKAHVGSVDITAISGYGISAAHGNFDVTNVFGPYTAAQFGVTGTLVEDDFRTSKFTQEVRLAMPIGERLEWLLGGFYTDERSKPLGQILAVDGFTGDPAGVWVVQDRMATYREYAAFSDLTVRLSDRIDVQFGGRESHNKQGYAETDTGPYVPVFVGGSSPAVTPESNSQDSSFTYLVTPRFRISPDLMIYARFASGYRPGGSNLGAPGAPATYKPDTTVNYEVGVKGDVLDRVLSFDGSIYDIEWNDLQLHVADLGNEYQINGGGARSRGAELSVESRPIGGLTLDAWVSWDSAILTQDMPPISTVSGVSGEQLPYSARFSGHLSFEQTFAVTDLAAGFVGGSVSYVGARQGEFAGTAVASSVNPRQDYPAYTTVDVKTGLLYRSWSANLYANNVTNRRGLLGGGLNSVNPAAFLLIQPRMVGLSLSYTFE